jgi:hypothetical protein
MKMTELALALASASVAYAGLPTNESFIDPIGREPRAAMDSSEREGVNDQSI